MKKALIVNILRSIWRTKNRFFSIFAIVFIGAAFFAGIKVTCDDIKLTANDYFTRCNLSDFKVMSTYGLTQEDIDAFSALEEVSCAEAGYYADVLVNKGTSEEVAVRLYSLPQKMNSLELIEGRMPQNPGECVVEKNEDTPSDYVIGNKLTFSAGSGDEEISDKLARDTYTIVGIVNSSMYISTDRDSTDIGSGTINSYIFMPAEDFAFEEYTILYLRMSNLEGIDAFSDTYSDRVDQNAAFLEEFAQQRGDIRMDQIRADAQKELEQPMADLQEAKDTLARETADAQKKIDDSAAELADGQAELDAQKEAAYAELDAAQEEINAGNAKIAQAQSDINAQESSLVSAKKTIEQKTAELDVGQRSLDAARQSATAQFDTSQQQLDAQKAAVLANTSLSQAEKAAALAQIAAQQQQLDQSRQAADEQFDAKQKEISDGRAQIAAQQEEIISGEQQLTAAKAELETQKQTLLAAQAAVFSGRNTARSEFSAAQGRIDSGRAQLDSAQQELDSKTADAQQEIDSAQQEIDSAQREIDELAEPVWYVLDRNDFPGYGTLKTDAERIDNLSRVLPVFFILIAFLVCLTTMTRMVDEERTQIGTQKALGYSTGQIMSKYVFYAIAASIAGSVIGVSVGFAVFPPVFFRAYSMLYRLPELLTPYYPGFSVILVLVAVLSMTAATVYAVYKSLFEQPAALMRPKAPHAGKKILLEKWTFFWKRMSFKRKITARNLFRYKKRMVMTIIGIAGGTALMLTGFGLQHAFSSIVPKQYGEIMVYDAIVVMEDDLTAQERSEVVGELEQIDGIAQHTLLYMQDGTLDDTQTAAYLMVPEAPQDISAYINLIDLDSQEPLSLDDSGVIASQKIGNILDLAAGGNFDFHADTGQEASLKLSALTQNYAMNYVYLTPEYYAEAFGEEPAYNSLFINLGEGVDKDDVASKIAAIDNVKGASFKEDSHNTFLKSIDNMNYIVFIIILSAGFLAFIVLYNLVNINVGERIRELATLKVLGFRDFETTMYIYRENAVCTVLGIILGLALGVLLERYVLREVEVDRIVFIKTIDFFSYLWSTLLTLLFALIVNVLLHRKLKKINMAESLKSIE